MFRTFAAIVGMAATLPSVALAHATLETAVASPDSDDKAVVRIGHGCDGAATHTVRVTVPEGVISVKPMPKAGREIDLQVADSGQHGHGSMSQDAMSDSGMTADGSYRVGDLTVETPWARATTGRAGGAFMMIHDAGSHGDRLIGVEADISDRVQLHTTVMEDGVMRMRHVEDGIEVPAGGMAELKPGGFHVMFMGLKQPLAEGDSFPVTLVFERAGAVTVDVTVEAAGAMEGSVQHSH